MRIYTSTEEMRSLDWESDFRYRLCVSFYVRSFSRGEFLYDASDEIACRHQSLNDVSILSVNEVKSDELVVFFFF